MRAVISPFIAGIALCLILSINTGCGKKEASQPDTPAVPTAQGAGAAPSGQMPPQAAAAREQQTQGMAAQKRMNDEMAKARQAAEQSGKK